MIISKYKALWEYVQSNGNDSSQLTFEEIQNIAGTPINHSFLKIKKRANKILLSSWKNIYEEANSSFIKSLKA